MRAAAALTLSSFISAFVASGAELLSLSDYDVSSTFNDLETGSDVYSLDDEHMSLLPDQMNQDSPELISDLDTTLWTTTGDECFLDDSSLTTVIQKRNDACSSTGSLDQPDIGSQVDQQAAHDFLESGKKKLVSPTEEDSDICASTQLIGASWFAVCDSGRESDRILNWRTGEYTLFHCERSKH